MDRGKILFKKKIKIYSQDNLKDFCLRIQSLELELMIKSLDAIKKNKNRTIKKRDKLIFFKKRK